MSSVFELKMIRKSKTSKAENGDIILNDKPIYLFDLTTTPARELASEVGLAYDQNTIADKSFINEVVEYYKSQIENNNRMIKREKEKIDLILSKGEKIESEYLDNLLNNYSFLVQDCEEENELLKNRLDSFNFAYDVYNNQNFYYDEDDDPYVLLYYYA